MRLAENSFFQGFADVQQADFHESPQMCLKFIFVIFSNAFSIVKNYPLGRQNASSIRLM